jgi:hypothetical protein
VTNNNWFWIGWLDPSALLSQSQSIIINIISHNRWPPKTSSIPYWTTSVFAFIVTDLVLIYESVTSSASAVRWLTLHSWTLNHDCNLTDFSSTNDLWINYMPSFYTSVRTEYRTLPSTVHIIPCPSVAVQTRVNSAATNLLPSEPCVSKPLSSNGRLFWLHYSSFQASRHSLISAITHKLNVSRHILI